MKKGDIFSGSGLEWYAEIGLVIFVLAFLFILFRVFIMKKNKADVLSEIPLDDDILADERADAKSSSGKEAP